MTANEIEGIPWTWLIPKSLVPRFNLEDVYNSNHHHYGVRCSTLDQIQPADTGWERGLDILLSRRLRKVHKVSDEKESSMELSTNGGEKGSLFFLLHNPDVQ